MTARKIIEDSDDEDHDNSKSPSKVVANVLSTSRADVKFSSSPSSKNLQNDKDSSPGSTERLSREIQDAQNKLLEQTPDGRTSPLKTMCSFQQLPLSPEVLRSKSRRATTGVSEWKDKKALITYGSKASQETEFYSSSNVGLGYTPTKKIHFVDGSSISQEHSVCDMATVVALEYSGSNHFEGQERGNIGPTESLKKTFPNTGHTQISDISTIPLSTEEDKILPAQSTSVIKSSHLSTKSSTDPMPSPTLSERSLKDVNSPSSPEEDNAKSRKRTFSQVDFLDNNLGHSNKKLSLPAQHANKISGIDEASALLNSGDEKLNQDINDELSLSVIIPMTKLKPSKSKKLEADKRKADDNFGSDEISTDLPAERYQPRPSRSRCGLVDDKLLVPIDFSKRPETSAKRKRKNRRKTTAFEQLICDEDDDDDITETIQNSREGKFYQEPPTQPVVPANVPQVMKLLDNPQLETSEPDSIAKAPSPKKRGRPKKQPPGALGKSPNEQDPNPSKPPAPNHPPASKRKPKGTPHPLSDTDSDPDPNPEEKTPPILSETTPNALLPPQTQPSSPTKPPPQTPQKPSPPPFPSPSTTTTTTTTTTAKGPDKHSPLNSGKVAYRVGLSKRARIEPLLRVVRK